MVWGIVRSLVDRLREEEEERQAADVLKRQAAIWRRWMRQPEETVAELGVSPAQLNPEGFQYEAARIGDDSLRPGGFLRRAFQFAREAAPPTGLEALAQGFAPPLTQAPPFMPGADIERGGQIAQQFFKQPPEDLMASQAIAESLPYFPGVTPGGIEQFMGQAAPGFQPGPESLSQEAQALWDAQQRLNMLGEQQYVAEQGLEPSEFTGTAIPGSLGTSPFAGLLPEPIPEVLTSRLGPAAGPARRSLELTTSPLGIASMSSFGVPLWLGGEAGAVALGTSAEAAGAPPPVQIGAEVTGGVIGGIGGLRPRFPRRAPAEIGQEFPEAVGRIGDGAPALTVAERPRPVVPEPEAVGPRAGEEALPMVQGVPGRSRRPLREFSVGDQVQLSEQGPVYTVKAVRPKSVRLEPPAPSPGVEPREITQFPDVEALPVVPAEFGRAAAEAAPAAVGETAEAVAELERLGVEPIRGADPGGRLIEAINAAKRLGPEQKALRAAEVGRRGGRLAGALQREPGEAGIAAGLGELKGPLPKLTIEAPEKSLTEIERAGLFESVSDFFATGRPSYPGAEEIDWAKVLKNAISEGETGDTMLKRLGIPRTAKEELARLTSRSEQEGIRALRSYEELNTRLALQNLLIGELPREFEVGLLEQVFGPRLTKALLAKRSMHEKLADELLAVLGIPRTLKSTFDHSMPFRQDVIQSLDPTRARQTARIISKSTQALLKKEVADDLQLWMRTLPEYQAAKEAGVPFTSHTGLAYGIREEPFMTASERTWVGRTFRKLVPPVRMADQAASTELNLRRLALWQEMSTPLEQTGRLTGDLKGQIGELTGVLTGRGSLPRQVEKFNPLLNQVFFSLRLQSARVKVPWLIGKGLLPGNNRIVAKLMGKQFAKFVVTGMTILGAIKAANIPGVDVELDPRSANFARVKIGPTRIDFWGGFQPYVRFIARAVSRQTKTAMGEIVPTEIEDLVSRLILSKLAPVAGAEEAVRRGETFIGEQVDLDWAGVKTLLPELFVPMIIESVIDGFREQGMLGMLLALPEFIGVSVNSYTPDSVRVGKLIQEDLMTGKLTGEYDRIPKFIRELNLDDKTRFEELHPEIFEELEEKSAETMAGLGEREQGTLFGTLTSTASETVHAGLDKLRTDVRRERYGEPSEQDARSDASDRIKGLFSQRRGAIVNAEKVFTDQVGERAEREALSTDQRVLQRFFDLNDQHEDRQTDEEWAAYEAAFSREFSSSEQRIIEEQLAVGDHKVEKEWHRLNALLSEYYEVPEDDRERWREGHAEADGALWALGRVSRVMPGHQQEGADAFDALYGVRVSLSDISIGEGGSRRRPSRQRRR